MTARNLALYMGCKVKCKDGLVRKLVGVCEASGNRTNIRTQVRMDDYSNVLWYDVDEVKLILRPFSDLTDAEKAYLVSDPVINPKSLTIIRTYASFEVMLSMGIDLFGLIERGEAIDATKL